MPYWICVHLELKSGNVNLIAKFSSNVLHIISFLLLKNYDVKCNCFKLEQKDTELNEEITEWKTKYHNLEASAVPKDDTIEALREELAKKTDDATMYKTHADDLQTIVSGKEKLLEQKTDEIAALKVWMNFGLADLQKTKWWWFQCIHVYPPPPLPQNFNVR